MTVLVSRYFIVTRVLRIFKMVILNQLKIQEGKSKNESIFKNTFYQKRKSQSQIKNGWSEKDENVRKMISDFRLEEK